MKNYVIIHGHFYQPPREDPWTGLIPTQESAAPYHDWNVRITRECYAANAYSRVLDPLGRITSIINNYEHMSFNIGPTLLWWLKSNAPRVYRRIVEADHTSGQHNNGHGNAIAQAYNHTILPLSTPKDIRIQVSWGIEDFRFHFDRMPEGIWVAETAVNPLTIDILIDFGIKFVILSPWQAESVRKHASSDFVSLEDKPIRECGPYILERPNGRIAVFFYNHVLAQGISFQHFLHNSEFLYDKILEQCDLQKQNYLLAVATDGEVYGHHEPFGDMCFAALVERIGRQDAIALTNFGNYLELFPPKQHVKLKPGEESKGT